MYDNLKYPQNFFIKSQKNILQHLSNLQKILDMRQYASQDGQGASLAVRPFRAILPTAKRRAPSAHEAADGYAAPRPPVHLAYA